MAVLNGSSVVVEYSDDTVPTNWYTLPNVLSVEPSFNIEEIDVTHNSTSGFKTFIPGDMDGTCNFTVRYDPALAEVGTPTWSGSHNALIGLLSAKTTGRFWRVSADGATPPNWNGQGFITSMSNPIAHSQGVDISFTVRFSQVNVSTGAITLTTA